MDHGRVSAVLAMIAVELLRTVLVTYLWRAERTPHLRWWSLGVAAQAGGQSAVTVSLLPGGLLWLQPIALVLVVFGTMALLRGTLALAERRWSRWWTVTCVVALIAGAGARSAGVPLGLAAAVPMAYLATAYAVMAAVLGSSRTRPPGLGAPVTAVAMALAALHLCDFPVMVGRVWFVPWGTAIALVLEVAITIGMVLVHFDVTRAARAADERHHAELTDALGVGTFETDRRGRFTRVNAALVALLGHDQADAVLALAPALDVHADPPTRALLDPGNQVDVLPGIDVAWKRRDGTVITVQLFARLRRGSDGTVLGRRGFVVDRTEAVRLEDGRRQAQKLEAVGRLAGGVAHDFNNLLTIIRASHDLVAGSPLPAAAREALADADEAVSQATQLTRRMLAFGRKPGGASTVVIEVGAVLRRTGKMLAPTLGHRHRLTLDGVDHEHWIRLDDGGLEQVMVNLVLNARDAMAAGGTIAVTVEDAVHEGRTGVALAVADTGSGISAADRPRVFEPFFTTKEAGRGTGLGLTTVHGLVEHAGGAIDIDSGPGRGTRFTIWFPVAPRSAPSLIAVTDRSAALRVLVVDDEPMIRRTVVRMLTEAGVEIAEAASGGEVIARHRAGERYDVVLSDVRMPGGDGPTAARDVRARAPATRIVLMSGHAGALDLDEPGLIDAFLPKPFTFEQLLAAVRGQPQV